MNREILVLIVMVIMAIEVTALSITGGPGNFIPDDYDSCYFTDEGIICEHLDGSHNGFGSPREYIERGSENNLVSPSTGYMLN